MLRFADPDAEGKRGRWWSLYWFGSQPASFSYRSALRQGGAFYAEGLKAMVQLFPADPKLTGLESAIRSRRALPRLLGGLSAEHLDWEGVSARVLSYKPSRRLTIRYRLERSGGTSSTLFGKCLPAGADLEVLALHRALEQAIRRDRLQILTVPIISGRVRDWNMLLWKRLAGQSLFDRLDSPQFAGAALRVGQCLAELHGSSTDWRRIHDRSRELATLRSWVTAAALAFPRLEPASRETLKGLTAAANHIPSDGLVPAHRDFFDKQIVLHDARVALLDFETAARAEPELDVGNFLAHLELRALQGLRLDVAETGGGFVETYSRRFRRPDPSRTTWYKAASLLRLACVYAFRGEWNGISERLGVAAEHTLADGGFSWR